MSSMTKCNPQLWIHCNSCYTIYIKKERKFLLLACNHILCESCVLETSNRRVNGPKIYQCRICNNKKLRACEMNNSMPGHLKELFHVEPNQEGINTLTVLQFQNIHLRRFLKYLYKGKQRMNDRNMTLLAVKKSAKESYEKLQHLRTERKQLERRIIEIKHMQREIEKQKVPYNPSPCSSQSSRPSVGVVNDEGITSFAYKPRKSFLL